MLASSGPLVDHASWVRLRVDVLSAVTALAGAAADEGAHDEEAAAQVAQDAVCAVGQLHQVIKGIEGEAEDAMDAAVLEVMQDKTLQLLCSQIYVRLLTKSIAGGNNSIPTHNNLHPLLQHLQLLLTQRKPHQPAIPQPDSPDSQRQHCAAARMSACSDHKYTSPVPYREQGCTVAVLLASSSQHSHLHADQGMRHSSIAAAEHNHMCLQPPRSHCKAPQAVAFPKH